MPNVPIILRAATAVEGLALLVDGYPARTHRVASRSGGEPLEDGREVTDHLVAAPRELSLTGIVSDLAGSQRPAEAWAAIEKINQDSEPVRVITEWGTYSDMIIDQCEGTASGRGMRFTMDVKEILRVSSATGPAVPTFAQRGPARFRSGEIARGRLVLAASLVVASGGSVGNPTGGFGGLASGLGVG